MDRLDAMRVFVRVVELGSFSAVAQQVGVARSVVTRQVAALETHLGAKLMLRSTRRLSLTSAGAAYLEKCRVILNLVEAAETDVAEQRTVARGRIRVGLPLSYGLKRLAPLLLEFAERHPQVNLVMDYTDRRVDLVEEGFDLSVRITARLGASEVVRRLGTCRLLAAAAPAYLARHGAPQRPAELADHVCLGYLGDPDPGAWPFTIDGRVEHVHVQTRLAASNGDVLADAAARGLGITLQPDFIVASYLDDGRLQPVLAEFAPPELGIYALLPAGRHVTYRVRVLIEFLAERLKAPRPGPGPRQASMPDA
jgi:DNA-binding transcriptional LysR family regulator